MTFYACLINKHFGILITKKGSADDFRMFNKKMLKWLPTYSMQDGIVTRTTAW